MKKLMNSTFKNPVALLCVMLMITLASCKKDPQACFGTDRGGAPTKVDQEITFNATCSTDADSYLWDFGDGSSEYGYLVKHKYSNDGNYVVTLVVSSKGKFESLTQTVTIIE